MKITAIHDAFPSGQYQRCPECDVLFILPPLGDNQNACCPRCQAKVVRGHDWSMTRLAALAVTLLLMPFAYTEPLISIRLLGTPIRDSLLQGIWQMALQGNIITASMVAFCTVGAPVTLVFTLLYLYFGQRLGLNLRPVLLMLHRLKEWVMLDIYLVGMAVASIKVKDYADVTTGLGLTAYVILTLLTILTLIKLNTGQLWQHFFHSRHRARECR
ncbi:Intermembrane transport protein YebS [Sodalis praecaptivus]